MLRIKLNKITKVWELLGIFNDVLIQFESKKKAIAYKNEMIRRSFGF